MSAVASPAPPNPELSRRKFTLRQRILLRLITWTATLAIRLLCRTLRFSTSWEEGSPGSMKVQPIVYSCWHNCIIPALYLARDRRIGVMVSESFDGECIARVLHNFGFVAVRGSSSRGAVRATLGMRREVEEGWKVVFTIDGPRGPRYVAKPGPVLLARATGVPLCVFHVALEREWILNSWDRLTIPKPFARALLRVSRQIPVPPEGDDEVYLKELQSTLDRTRIFAEENVHKVGTPEFPFFRGE